MINIMIYDCMELPNFGKTNLMNCKAGRNMNSNNITLADL